MLRDRGASSVVALLMISAGCSSSSGPSDEVIFDQLVGSWEATTLTYTSQEDGSLREDLLEGGGQPSLTIEETGRYRFVVSPASGPAEESTGVMLVEGGFLLARDDDPLAGTVAFGITLSGETLGLVTDEVDYDFGGDGEVEPAILQIGLRRASGTSLAGLEVERATGVSSSEGDAALHLWNEPDGR